MKSLLTHIALWLSALASALLPVACSKDDLSVDAGPDAEAKIVSDFTLKLTLAPQSASPGRAVRANYDDPEVPGVSRDGVQESAINTIYLFFEDTAANPDRTQGKGTKAWFRYQVNYDGATPTTLTLPVSALNSMQGLTYGMKNVYVGVNLTEAQAEHFAKGNGVYAIDSANWRYGLTEDLAPGRGIGLGAPTTGYSRKDIAMFGLTGRRLELVEGQEEYVCDSTFELKRTVAKVLATCELNNAADGVAGENYANLSGLMVYPEGYFVENLRNKGRGWIRQSSVGFLVNALNMKTYLMQRRQWNMDNANYDLLDPNYTELEQYLGMNNGQAVPQNYSNDFYYTTVQQRSEVSDYYVRTLPYDPSRMVTGSSSHYYEGLYCPENTFTTDAITIDDTDHQALSIENRNWLLSYNLPWPMVTHVSITTLFTPREIFVEHDMVNDEWWKGLGVSDGMRDSVKQLINYYDEHYRDVVYIPGFNNRLLRINTENEAMSQAILTASLRKENYLQDRYPYDPHAEGYPPNTYLYMADAQDNNIYRFFTFGAAKIIAAATGWKEADGLKNLGAFTAMPRGRGYYYTYIDNRANADPDKSPETLTFANGQVERNVYYILTVSSFSKPGYSPNTPDFVKVHTRIVDWKLGGKGTVTLD